MKCGTSSVGTDISLVFSDRALNTRFENNMLLWERIYGARKMSVEKAKEEDIMRSFGN